jgi:enterochelin esterase-like enzyme
MVVGVVADPDEDRRLEEYSLGFDRERFETHERFFTEDVPAWVGDRFGVHLPPERTAVFGASAGGELAIALGLRHPELFGTVLCGSPGGGYRPPENLPAVLPRAYFVAGEREPFFLANAGRWARALHDAGGDVRFARRDGGHGSALWRSEFPAMVRWAMG